MKTPSETGSTEPQQTATNAVTARVKSEREFAMQYSFRAPIAKVYAAYTDPTLVPQWWDPKGGSLRVDRMDVRPGGQWRYVQRLSNGQEVAYSGSYLEAQAPSRLVYSFAIEGQAQGGVTATVEFQEVDGVTRLTLTNLCSSKEARDAMIHYGAAAGAKLAWGRLAALLGGA